MNGIQAPHPHRTAAGLLALLRERGTGPRKALVRAMHTEPPDSPDFPRSIQSAAIDIGAWASQGIHTVGFFDASYPQLLRTIADPPPLIWIRGAHEPLSLPAIAVVGTREPSRFGKEVAETVTAAAVKGGWVVVSGLAHGIDTISHRTTVALKGITAAVLAGGLDHIYPAGNKDLAKDIVAKGGALLSENPPGSKPRAGDFVRRDRLQSGLSFAVFVCQTGRSGGTMHTARFAVQQGRPIFCPAPPSNPSDKDEGVALLLQLPAAQLPGQIREWADERWRPGQLARGPVASPFSRQDLPELLEWLRDERSREPLAQEFGVESPMQPELLDLLT